MKTDSIKSPIIYETNYNKQTSLSLEKDISESGISNPHLLIEYPTVYVIDTPNNRNKKYTVYVGETTNIQRRTQEHIASNRIDWESLKNKSDVHMYVIGHEHFNKSLTLDIENRLMQYLSGVDAVSHLNNRRYNEQNEYYTVNEFPIIFQKIWEKLHRKNKDLFPSKALIENSALFKASPFNKLTKEQLLAKQHILAKVDKALDKNLKHNEAGTLVLVEGNAGSGKTVLMSNLFYDLYNHGNELKKLHKDNEPFKIKLMVNHKEQFKVYSQIASKLLLDEHDKDIVLKPTTFINKIKPNDKVDVAIIDEAHLLLTQQSQAYYGHGDKELLDIIKRAKVILAVYDPLQVLQTTSVWTEKEFQELESLAGKDNIIHLKNQMRIDASEETINWIRNFIDSGIINKIPNDQKYSLKIFDNPQKMEEKIREKASDKSQGLSRMVATFDWKYSRNSPKDHQYWEVREGNWSMPWNLQLPHKKGNSVNYKNLAWAEQDHTINEIGSTYTIQGFDLNYVGVILGPSIKYRNGKVIIDPSESANTKAIQKRNSQTSYAMKLLRNELNVLLTRGVHGLYIHAVDKELQAALEQAVK
ncbi:DUF2075 domain-containing protein [Lactobacillus psittaci]|uniref:GIY-YIG domain-containing protein n=1 Tax=Lactobacillus psittaci DSM 15354 TaxID=1122152 RepID=A0A0R1S976_9LACO|nr:DUF2075 domain-containing protein [Lactobacillus psittaci]KRL62027.1 hypothetical protein FC23_GL000403 [Lactobacillus psittaci DSM 15354]